MGSNTSTLKATATSAVLPQPWTGRLFLLLGVILLGLSLRHAVTDVSPLLSTIKAELGLGTFSATLLGMLPTITFGIAGFITPAIIRWVGLPRVAVIALALGALGTVVRVFADGPAIFLVFGAVALFGMGMGNVVGPPLVKRYFPDRQGTAMSALVLTMQAGATIPAMLAVPVANAAGWRVSVGMWAVLMMTASLPWIAVLLRDRKQNSASPGATGAPATKVSADATYGLRVLMRNPVSIGAALFYGMAAMNTYAMLAWMPTIFASLGLSQGQAASMYSIYTFVTLPMALISPVLATKLKNPLPFGVLLSVVAAIGYLGMLFAPMSTFGVWAFIAGVGGGAFPFAMTMFNQRTRTSLGSASVTGFALGCGYAFGTVGPLLGGMLSSMSGSWTLPLSVLALTAIPMVIGVVMLTRDWNFEDIAAAKWR